MNYRIEQDTMGKIEVPSDALYAAQTQRAVNNFTIGGLVMPESFIRSLALVKHGCAHANKSLGLLDSSKAEAIMAHALDISQGKHLQSFVVDVFQTGSGTSSNMNANEVIANLCNKDSVSIHPNDDVNLGQSSNDVVPTSIAISAYRSSKEKLLPAVKTLQSLIRSKAKSLGTRTKTGRTHLMDAMPVRWEQELETWARQLEHVEAAIVSALSRLKHLPLGGTAVGTGINTHEDMARVAIEKINELTGLDLQASNCPSVYMSSQDNIVELSASLRGLAVVLTKISNDLRWMNSGPLSGMGDIELKALQPGSSIMPGKVNPVIPEAVLMASAQVVGNDATIALAGLSSNFQLNVMLPVIGYNIDQSITFMANACDALGDRAIQDFVVRQDNIDASISKNPILVTALNSVIGYEKAAEIAKTAYKTKRALLDVAEELTDLSPQELKTLLDPAKLTGK